MSQIPCPTSLFILISFYNYCNILGFLDKYQQVLNAKWTSLCFQGHVICPTLPHTRKLRPTVFVEELDAVWMTEANWSLVQEPFWESNLVSIKCIPAHPNRNLSFVTYWIDSFWFRNTVFDSEERKSKFQVQHKHFLSVIHLRISM